MKAVPECARSTLRTPHRLFRHLPPLPTSISSNRSAPTDLVHSSRRVGAPARPVPQKPEATAQEEVARDAFTPWRTRGQPACRGAHEPTPRPQCPHTAAAHFREGSSWMVRCEGRGREGQETLFTGSAPVSSLPPPTPAPSWPDVRACTCRSPP